MFIDADGQITMGADFMQFPCDIWSVDAKINIDKNLRMYYRVQGGKLIIVYFFDMRQNPERNLYEST